MTDITRNITANNADNILSITYPNKIDNFFRVHRRNLKSLDRCSLEILHRARYDQHNIQSLAVIGRR